MNDVVQVDVIAAAAAVSGVVMAIATVSESGEVVVNLTEKGAGVLRDQPCFHGEYSLYPKDVEPSSENDEGAIATVWSKERLPGPARVTRLALLFNVEPKQVVDLAAGEHPLFAKQYWEPNTRPGAAVRNAAKRQGPGM